MRAIPEHVSEGPSMAVSINILSLVFSHLGDQTYRICALWFSV